MYIKYATWIYNNHLRYFDRSVYSHRLQQSLQSLVKQRQQPHATAVSTPIDYTSVCGHRLQRFAAIGYNIPYSQRLQHSRQPFAKTMSKILPNFTTLSTTIAYNSFFSHCI